MFNIFKTKDEKLFRALKKDGIGVIDYEIQKARQNDPETLYKIGDIYYKKGGYEKAFPWFHKAALQNHVEAQAKVGYMYKQREGVSQDYQQAMDWSMKAASAGNAEAQYRVGFLYYCGDGVPEDNKQAMDWFLKAANNGNTEAMFFIGEMYQYGVGVTENIRTAIEWYTKAANQGNTEAQATLGVIYRTDDEVKNLQKAVNWYQKAADNNGNEYAKDRVKELNEQGYYAKEDEQEEEKTKEEDAATTNIANDQSQSSITTSNNDDHFNKLMESRMDHLEKTFQSKMTLIEGNNDALQNELAALRQKELQQDQENKQLRDELTKLKVATEDSINNDLNYDSSDNEGDDNTDTTDVGVMQGSDDALQKELAALKQRELDHQKENQQLKEKLAIMETGIEDDANNDLNYDSSDNDGDDNTDTADVGVMQGNNDALQNELAALKQKELEQHEENQRLKERLARMETDMQDNANNDLNYDSSDNESSHENDTNYDTERYTSEEDEEEEEEEENKTAANAQKNKMHDNLVKKYADPNYNSSDKEDPKNDIYLD